MIKKHYFCKDSIISIGSDCHPAYLLSQLHIRKNSLPFDWLATEPLNGLSYVEDNLKNDFRYFVNDLILNEKGNVIAPNYPSAEFLHDGGLEDSALIQEKYSRRVNRFKNIVKTQVIHYLYNIPSSCLETVVDIQIVYDSVINFLKIIKKINNVSVKNKIIKQIEKILENPEVGKHMRYSRKGTREVYISPYRLVYAYLADENKIIFLDIYHKDQQ